jgi:hypothetical protein
MDETQKAFYIALMNGTALDNSLPDRANTAVSTIVSKLGTLTGATANNVAETTVPGGAFYELSSHLSTQLTNLSANMDIYGAYTGVLMANGELNVHDSANALGDFFGSLLGEANAIIANVQVAADGLPSTANALLALADDVEDLMTTERVSFANALNVSATLSEATSLQAMLYDPISLIVLDAVANGAVANAVDDYQASQGEDFGWLFISDEDQPVSDDPTQFSDYTNADPTGPQSS